MPAKKKAKKKAKKRAAKRPAKKKPAVKKRAKKKRAKKKGVRRKRYNSLGQHEVIYSAWVAEGTIAGAVRRLRAIRGFADLDERTVKSIYQEKKGTEDDWDERARTFYRELAERVDTEMVEQVAALKVRSQKRLLTMLLKLADESETTLIAGVKRIRKEIKAGKLKGQDLAYGIPKLLDSIVRALRPPENTGARVNIDNRKLTLAVTSPREIAQREAKQTLQLDVTRRERAVDLARV